MEQLEKVIKWEREYYRYQEDGQVYLAEKIFMERKPRSRVILELLKKLERRINQLDPLDNTHFINYIGIEQIDKEYFLCRDEVEIYQPLTRYLRENEIDLEQIIDWVLILTQIAQETEDKGYDWSGFTLDTLWVDQAGQIKMTDPDIIRLIKQYRTSNEKKLLVEEVLAPPEVFQEQSWDEQSRLYSLGVIFYYLLTGQQPYIASNKSELLDKILNSRPVEVRYYNNQVSSTLNQLVMNLLAREKEERPDGFQGLMTSLFDLKKKDLLYASKKEEETVREKSSRLIKSQQRKERASYFFRHKWQWIAIPLLVIGVFLALGLFGGREAVVTKQSGPRDIVQLFYQAIDEKDGMLLKETSNLKLKKLEQLVTQVYVIEKMRQGYALQGSNGRAANKLFGIKDLEISLLNEQGQPVFKTSYIFYAYEDEELKEKKMEDTLRLSKSKELWQIVEIEGSIQGIIDGDMDKILGD